MERPIDRHPHIKFYINTAFVLVAAVTTDELGMVPRRTKL